MMCTLVLTIDPVGLPLYNVNYALLPYRVHVCMCVVFTDIHQHRSNYISPIVHLTPITCWHVPRSISISRWNLLYSQSMLYLNNNVKTQRRQYEGHKNP